MKVLIIEDDTALAAVYTRQLRSAGFDVSLATDGVVATTIARNERPDLVVLDIGLPGGGGLTVLSRLRSLTWTAATPVLVVTGSAMARDEAIAAGADELLRKPVTREDLVSTIVRMLDSEP